MGTDKMGRAAGGISVGSVAITGGVEGPAAFVDRLPHNSRKNLKKVGSGAPLLRKIASPRDVAADSCIWEVWVAARGLRFKRFLVLELL